MKNELIVILANQRKTVADVYYETDVPLETIEDIYYERAGSYGIKNVIKICDYLNVTPEELFARKMQSVRSQLGQRIMLNKLVRKTVRVDELARKGVADD